MGNLGQIPAVPWRHLEDCNAASPDVQVRQSVLTLLVRHAVPDISEKVSDAAKDDIQNMSYNMHVS
jgi:hypothetical protein